MGGFFEFSFQFIWQNEIHVHVMVDVQAAKLYIWADVVYKSYNDADILYTLKQDDRGHWNIIKIIRYLISLKEKAHLGPTLLLRIDMCLG